MPKKITTIDGVIVDIYFLTSQWNVNIYKLWPSIVSKKKNKKIVDYGTVVEVWRKYGGRDITIDDKVYSLQEISTMTNRSNSFLRKEIEKGKLPAFHFDRTIRISESDLKYWSSLNNNLVKLPVHDPLELSIKEVSKLVGIPLSNLYRFMRKGLVKYNRGLNNRKATINKSELGTISNMEKLPIGRPVPFHSAKYMTVKEASCYIECSLSKIYWLIKTGELNIAEIKNGIKLLDRLEIEDYKYKSKRKTEELIENITNNLEQRRLDGFVTMKEASAICNLPVSTIRDLMDNGTIPFERTTFGVFIPKYAVTKISNEGQPNERKNCN